VVQEEIAEALVADRLVGALAFTILARVHLQQTLVLVVVVGMVVR